MGSSININESILKGAKKTGNQCELLLEEVNTLYLLVNKVLEQTSDICLINRQRDDMKKLLILLEQTEKNITNCFSTATSIKQEY